MLDAIDQQLAPRELRCRLIAQVWSRSTRLNTVTRADSPTSRGASMSACALTWTSKEMLPAELT